MLNYDIVIIGGGPAGLGAAIEARRNGIDSILVIERDIELGGILRQCIHNGFGLHEFDEELTGPEYAERFISQIEDLSIDYKVDTMVLEILEDKRIVAINTIDGYMTINAKTIILAVGCRERTRGAISIAGDRPSGVLTAGTAQRLINIDGYMIGKRVVIIGSGDIGLIMARRLTLEGAKVLAVTSRSPYAKGLTRNVIQCLHDYDIPLLVSHNIVEIIGRDRVRTVKIARLDENKRPIKNSEKVYECDTVLFSVGLIPEIELPSSVGISIDKRTGGPIVNESMETSIDGIFACGNIVQVHDVVDFVTLESRIAGRSAAAFIKGELNDDSGIKTINGDGISYIVPQNIRLKNLDKTLRLSMRVSRVYNKSRIIVKSDKHTLCCINKTHMLPGEMEVVNLDKDILSNDIKSITLYVEEA